MMGQIEKHFGQEVLSQAVTHILNNKHNQVTSTYYLLMKKLERDTGKNYVFEKVTTDKKLKSATQLQSSAKKSSVAGVNPARIMMNQTMGGNFYSQSSKSEGKPKLDVFNNASGTT